MQLDRISSVPSVATTAGAKRASSCNAKSDACPAAARLFRFKALPASSDRHSEELPRQEIVRLKLERFRKMLETDRLRLEALLRRRAVSVARYRALFGRYRSGIVRYQEAIASYRGMFTSTGNNGAPEPGPDVMQRPKQSVAKAPPPRDKVGDTGAPGGGMAAVAMKPGNLPKTPPSKRPGAQSPAVKIGGPPGSKVDVPSDTRAAYELVEISAAKQALVVILTKRTGLSGISYSRRECECRTKAFRYLGSGDTLEAARRPKIFPNPMTKLAATGKGRGSISFHVCKFACDAGAKAGWGK